MSYHLVTDGRVLAPAFTTAQDAYVYVLLRLESDVPAVNRWALIERGAEGDELVVPIGEVANRARRWRQLTRAAEQAASPRPESFRQAS